MLSAEVTKIKALCSPLSSAVCINVFCGDDILLVQLQEALTHISRTVSSQLIVMLSCLCTALRMP